MRFTVLAVATAFIGAAAASPTPTHPSKTEPLTRRQIPALECAALSGGIHVIAAGGANTDVPKSYGLLGGLATQILKDIPGSTNVSLPYNKVFAVESPRPSLAPGAITTGAQTLVSYINNYHYYCPSTKIALIGYSSGAIINLNTLCGGMVSSSLAGSTIIATVSYGEETRVGGLPYDVGTCPSQYNGLAPRANPDACYPFANGFRSYCDNLDPDCCKGSGNDVSVHLSYDATYDEDAAAFVKSQYMASM